VRTLLDVTMRLPQDEPALWACAILGDEQAFTTLYETHRVRVFGHALRSTRSAHDAEDVTAVVFLELWRNRRRVQPVNDSLIGWLLLTTNYVVRNHHRSARRHRAALSRLSPPVAAENPSDAVDAGLDHVGQAAEIRHMFAQLTAKDQDILTLCVLEEQTLLEASQALKIPVGTVKSRLSRAKYRMARLMEASPVYAQQRSAQ